MARILIIDDDPRIRRMLEAAFEVAGHEVDSVANGKDALRHYVGNPADLVITDIFMPEMDGIEFLMRLQELFPDARLIAMSGGSAVAGRDVLQAARVLGAVEVIHKPFELDEIRSLAAEVLANPAGSSP